MSDNNAPEPTMEEILASIRRIISEDEPAAAPSSEAATASPPHGDPQMDDVLELTEPLDEAAPEPGYAAPEPEPEFETSGDLDIYSRTETSVPAAAPPPAPSYASSYIDQDEEELVGAPAAQSASSAFGQLSRTIAMPADGRSLEDVVRELLRPLLRDWLDANLPGIVEKAVQLEVERIARRR